ncbi:MAG: helix-turn-helix transcriptional regulator [Burkholderiales bacterium]|nr:helix-turn-helix transcriptional regulator [Burkholderiales bacterium]
MSEVKQAAVAGKVREPGEDKRVEELRREIGARIRKARGRDVSRKTLASWIGMHENTVAKMERGEAVLDAAELATVARNLRTSPEWLLYGVEVAPTKALPTSEPEAQYAAKAPLVPHALLGRCLDAIEGELQSRGKQFDGERRIRLAWALMEMSRAAGVVNAQAVGPLVALLADPVMQGSTP